MTQNANYTREYLNIVDTLDGDLPGRRAAHAYMDSSTAIVHGTHVISSYVPRLFDRKTYDAFKNISETTYSICCKIMQRYLDDASYRSIFDYDPRLVDLILLPRGYDALLPFMRADIFLNEDDLSFGFCELNADGSSGMNEDRELNNSFTASSALARFKQSHQVQSSNLFDTWVDEFMRIYASFDHAIAHPRVAIVDIFDNAITEEFKVFCQTFARHGVDAFMVDARELTYDGTHLRDKQGVRIDAIWRRIVTNDVLAYWDDVQPLINAVADEKVALIGGFAGHIVHDKQIFDAMHHPSTQAFLTTDEIALIQAGVPQTKFLDASQIDLNAVIAQKDKWIIKPTDSYGARDVYAGNMYSSEDWQAIVNRFANGAAGAPFLVQTYNMPFKTELIPPCYDISAREDDQVPRQTTFYNNLNGLYVYNGTFAGIFSRLGPQPVISEPLGDLTSATMWVDCNL